MLHIAEALLELLQFAISGAEFEDCPGGRQANRRRLLTCQQLDQDEAAVQEAGTWAVMSAYNKLNGAYCSEHPDLLGRILKDEWLFDGVVVSDWDATCLPSTYRVSVLPSAVSTALCAW